MRAAGSVPRQRQHVGAERGQYPGIRGDAGVVQRVEVGVECLQRSRTVRAAEADDEAARVIGLQGSIRRDDVGRGHRIDEDDAGGDRNVRRGPHRCVEHRQVAERHSVENPKALNALRFAGHNRRVVGVWIAAGEADGAKTDHEVDVRTSTELQVKARSALAAGAHAEQHILPRGTAGFPLRARGSFGAGGGSGALTSGSSKSSCATGASGRSGPGEVGVDQLTCASSNAVTVPPCAPGVYRKCAALSDKPAFHAICTVQRPSSLRHASQLVASGSGPRATSATTSPSPTTSAPKGRRRAQGARRLPARPRGHAPAAPDGQTSRPVRHRHQQLQQAVRPRRQPDLGLNLLGTQHVWNLGIGLALTRLRLSRPAWRRAAGHRAAAETFRRSRHFRR